MEMKEWIVQMNEQVQQQQHRTDAQQMDDKIRGNARIFSRVPEHVREAGKPSMYNPRKISIGPYHHGTPHCIEGQRDKEKCLIKFLSRSPNVLLEVYIDSVKEMVGELRNMYDGLDESLLDDNAFVKMMVVDGCYLLEIMMEGMEARGYGDLRPQNVFNHSEMEDYKHDMLLLDNQMPIKVLARIHEKSKLYSAAQLEGYMNLFNDCKPIFSAGQMKDKRIMQLFNFVNDLVSWDGHENYLKGEGDSIENERKSFDFLVLLIHGFFSLPGDGTLEGESKVSLSSLLEIYRWGLLGGETYTNSPIGYSFLVSSFYDSLPSATQLEEAQIGIRPSLHACQIDVSFSKRTGLMLQQISIDAATRSNFQNAVLYERLYPSQNYHLSSYFYFMHCLLKDAADSRLLKARGILNTTLHDQAVLNLFNDLGKNISFHRDKPMDKRIWEVGVELSQRFNKNMETWRKDLFQKYLNSSWAYVSIFVAFLIFAFTAFQTIYTILGYYRGNN